jgi:hypothetical protein
MKIVSLPMLKDYLEKTDTAQDSLLSMLIDQTSKRVETYLNRQLVKLARTQYFDAGRKLYFLSAYPIDLTAPFVVTYNGTTYTRNTDYFVWDNESYVEFSWTPTYWQPRQISITWTGGYVESPIAEVTGTDGLIYRCIASHIAAGDNKPITGPDYESYWTLAGSTGGSWVSGELYCDHSYLLGAPDDLASAVMMQCAYVFRKRKESGLASLSYPDGSKSWFDSGSSYRPIGRGVTSFLPEGEGVLKSYRKLPTER